jgi:hypothetical protein
MTYRFFALDMNDNLGWVPNKTVRIVDNDLPAIGEDLTNDTAMCGELFRFEVEASDNVAIGGVIVEYWFGEGPHYKAEMQSDETYLIDIMIPETEGRDLVYFMKAADTSGNTIENDAVQVTVKDLIPPVMLSDDTPSTAKTGSTLDISVKATDNIGMNRIVCNWSRIGDLHTELYLVRENGLFTGSINLPPDEVDQLVYSLTIVDSSGNQIKIGDRAIDVIDTISPTIQQTQNLEIGTRTELDIEIIASDNVEVSSLVIENSPIAPTGKFIKGTIDEPGTYIIRVVATDSSGNNAEMSFKIVVEGSGSAGEEKESTSPIVFILPLIGVAIMIAALILFFLQKRKEDAQEMPPLPGELTGEQAPQGPDDELERLFNQSYNGGH